MSRKTFTFLITSNRKSQTKSLTLSSSFLKLILTLILFIGVMLSSMAVDYVGLLLESGENKRLKAENASLKRQFQIVETKVKSLENSLERVKSFSTKIKLITDVDSEDRTLNLAMGPNSRSVQQRQDRELKDKFGGERGLAEGVDDDENEVFFGNRPSDSSKGEILKFDLKNYATLSIRIDQSLKESNLRQEGVLDLYNKLSKHKSLLKATPTIRPTKGWYTAKFGYHMDPFSGKPVMHKGLDIAAPEGTPVSAPADGVVSHIGYENNLGKVLTIDHGYGLKTRFAHNSQIFVETGQKVSRKDVVAAVGNTGRSQGPHLYYEVRVHGVPVDPLSYIVD